VTDVWQKRDAVRQILAGMDSVLVAFSGGVDSSLLLRLAVETLGARCTALTTTSPSVPDHDLDAARGLADELGVRHLVVATDELSIPDYARNPVNRCYFCKENLFRICRGESARLGINHIVDGANLDDLGDHRPGMAAATEAGIRHPLIEAGLGKQDVRLLSRALGLQAWDRPASPCLSSRVPYGLAVTPERLAQIAAGERFLRGHGLREVRVRHHDRIARLELAVDDLSRVLEPGFREALLEHFRGLGFTYVTLDLAGFRSGSLNEVLPPPLTPPRRGAPPHREDQRRS
jgi:uncharacterized protein